MEWLLPAARIEGFASKPGAKLGLNLNLTVPGARGRSEVYWPQSKADGAMWRPQAWGRAEFK